MITLMTDAFIELHITFICHYYSNTCVTLVMFAIMGKKPAGYDMKKAKRGRDMERSEGKGGRERGRKGKGK